jgi:AraC-like DNA-binding protein
MPPIFLQYQLDMEKESIWLTVTPSASIRAALPFVQELGDFITRGNYYTTREGLASYLIKYTLSGEGILEYGGETYNVVPGSIFWIDCEKKQHYCTSPQAGEWRMLWVHFYGNTCRQYYDLFLQQNGGKNTLMLSPENDVPAMIRTLLGMYGVGENSLATDTRASGMLSHVMSECCIAALGGQTPVGQPDSVRSARTYLLSNYGERITLDNLAYRYSINKYYFQKLFKKHTGYTPNEFLILARLNKAKEYLRTTDFSVGEVAEKVGVENVSHFINLFKKNEGVTPNAYRQMWYR